MVVGSSQFLGILYPLWRTRRKLPTLSSTEAIKSAATLKQIRLYIGDDARDDEVKTPRSNEMTHTMPQITKFKHKKLTPYTTKVPLRYQGIELARYHQEAFLIEWKVAEGAMWKQISDQVRSLATMVASPAGKNSQSLLCLGCLLWEERELYALVYEIPNATRNEAADHWKLKTLRPLLRATTPVTWSPLRDR